ncbi:hypothetical protein CPAST_c40230 [Clostridium pasteurianum DSM 525 = ATCC 6013]|uniref:Uncharacterized protein n=1 Tax=Clostridium pasteurianum DSM 525 = ATCC 6013 TaxID=1262449 RepID=A0A0H3J9L5_CLOPA|nr:DUF6711 family protein [Clostridium pasteurianum]AJA50052.1 hypothetical protein CPAST_c40230 [Clostridium pasteurianum DSM 525 = ATCC 6013]AJA54040.1 hypothetical protein CLPA_c40230 [Clostridium pasteurianum DSM 525 = ATCC 6013]AOZ77178.1 hypothetical protein AQ983_19560 [Clostridium pasteurianum DSM 525 = ATCC 6013]AOZ80975.1 hypothetical protein AQ984_19555 [Clostridium pasteurianum]ELP59243.1 hypothetical protein F502_10193 [Clostridium pasteurianum DSM 525 = ATCC 6013]
MALLIGGAAVAAPKSFQVNLIDLDSDKSNRNAKGVLMRDRIRQMRKLECEWGPLKSSEIKVILQAVNPVGVPVTYPDPYTGNDQTRTFYAGDRTAPAYDFSNETWLGLKMDLIEV